MRWDDEENDHHRQPQCMAVTCYMLFCLLLKRNERPICIWLQSTWKTTLTLASSSRLRRRPFCRWKLFVPSIASSKWCKQKRVMNNRKSHEMDWMHDVSQVSSPNLVREISICIRCGRSRHRYALRKILRVEHDDDILRMRFPPPSSSSVFGASDALCQTINFSHASHKAFHASANNSDRRGFLIYAALFCRLRKTAIKIKLKQETILLCAGYTPNILADMQKTGCELAWVTAHRRTSMCEYVCVCVFRDILLNSNHDLYDNKTVDWLKTDQQQQIKRKKRKDKAKKKCAEKNVSPPPLPVICSAFGSIKNFCFAGIDLTVAAKFLSIINHRILLLWETFTFIHIHFASLCAIKSFTSSQVCMQWFSVRFFSSSLALFVPIGF